MGCSERAWCQTVVKFSSTDKSFKGMCEEDGSDVSRGRSISEGIIHKLGYTWLSVLQFVTSSVYVCVKIFEDKNVCIQVFYVCTYVFASVVNNCAEIFAQGQVILCFL